MQGLGPELHIPTKALMGGYFHSILETKEITSPKGAKVFQESPVCLGVLKGGSRALAMSSVVCSSLFFFFKIVLI